MAQVVCGIHTCARLKTDGIIVTWGDIGNGWDTQGIDVNVITQVMCGIHACAGLKTDGSVVAWGEVPKVGIHRTRT